MNDQLLTALQQGFNFVRPKIGFQHVGNGRILHGLKLRPDGSFTLSESRYILKVVEQSKSACVSPFFEILFAKTDDFGLPSEPTRENLL